MIETTQLNFSATGSQFYDLVSENSKKIPKTKLHPLVYGLNVFSMLFFGSACPYYFFAPRSEGQIKGIVAGCSIGLAVIVMIPTLLYIAPVKKIFQLAFLIDTILLVKVAAVVAFINMMLIFDKGGTWYYPLIQVSFAISMFFYSTMSRVLLVTVDWMKWQVVVFKIHLMLNCLLFFVSGIHFIFVDFTFTNHRLKSFDNKVHDMMVMFIFSMVGYVYEIFAKVTDLDHTGMLRYVYKIKNMDETHPVKTKQIIRKRKETFNSLRFIEFGEKGKVKDPVKCHRRSRFAEIEAVTYQELQL